jgi:hypothetical protein
MRNTSSACLFAALLFTAAPLSAQPWDTPTFFSPRPGEDIGIYLVDFEGVDDLGFMGIWRQEGNLNLGVRLGIHDDDRIAVGGEFYGPVRGLNAPLLMSWVIGVGGTFDGFTWVRIPAGISVGALFNAGNLEIMPYVHPRVAFDYISIEDSDADDSELNFDLDLGADVSLGPRWVFRFGASVAEFDAIGVGIAYRFGRRLVVR